LKDGQRVVVPEDFIRYLMEKDPRIQLGYVRALVSRFLSFLPFLVAMLSEDHNKRLFTHAHVHTQQLEMAGRNKVVYMLT
jgi:hypothetical protein